MEWWQYPITQGFGPTGEPLDSGYGGYAHFNKGIDFGVPLGTSIYALEGGTVISVGDVGDGWGTRVWVQDAAGNVHNYGHLGQAIVTTGQQIMRGTQLGLSGNTGASTGPHISYDVWDANGNYFDPTGYISAASTLTGAPLMVGPPMQTPPAPDPDDIFGDDGSGAQGGIGNVGTAPAQATGGIGSAATPPPGTSLIGPGLATGTNPVTGGPLYYSFDPVWGWQYQAGAVQPQQPQQTDNQPYVTSRYNPETGQVEQVGIDRTTGQVIWVGGPTGAPKENTAANNTISLGSTLGRTPYQQGQLGNSTGPTGTQTQNVRAGDLTSYILGQRGIDSRDVSSMGSSSGQRITGYDAAASQAAAFAQNQQGNVHQGSTGIMAAYGINSTGDPIKDAAIAASVGSQASDLIATGIDPVAAQQILMAKYNTSF